MVMTWDGRAICRRRTGSSETSWWRRGTSMTRSPPTETVSSSPSVSPPPIAIIRDGSAISLISYMKIGNVLLAQGKLEDALRAYRNNLPVTQRLAAGSNNLQQQGDLSVSYSKLGNVLVAKGNLDDALKAYRDSLAIAQRLAASDRNNTQRQRDLILSYEKVSDVPITQVMLYVALKVRPDSLASDERLATADRSNVGAESGQSASYVKVADTLQGEMPQIRAFSSSRWWRRNNP